MNRQKLFKSDAVKSINSGQADRYTDSKGKVIITNQLSEAQVYQSLEQISITSKRDVIMPPLNKRYLRLYGHYMCPFVERVRLALAAKGLRDY